MANDHAPAAPSAGEEETAQGGSDAAEPRPTRILGLLDGPAVKPGRLSLRVVVARAGETLATVTATPNGQFAVDLENDAGTSGPVDIRAIAADDMVLGSVSLELIAGQDHTCEIPVPGATPESAVAIPEDPPLVDVRRATRLRAEIARLEDSQVLATGSTQTLAAALEPLEWLGGLRADAESVLLRDPVATSRLRTVLLAYAPAPSTTRDEPRVSMRRRAQPPRGSDRTSVVNPAGLAPLLAGAVLAGDEHVDHQNLLDGLSAALWTRPWLEALERAVATGDVPAMQTMMGAIPSPIDVPVSPPGGIPGFPGRGPLGNIPGKKLVPVKVSPTVLDFIPHFRVPINMEPSDHEICLITAALEVAARVRALPRYTITALDQPDACAGAVLTMTGTGFGPKGMVDFPGPSKPVSALSWSDTTIQVVVPPDAAPGDIQLTILESQFQRCGREYYVYRPGDSTVTFNGGIPVATSLLVNYSEGDSFAEPGATVVVIMAVTDHPNVRVDVVARTVAGTVFTTTLPGGGHSFDFALPVVTTPTPCQVDVTLTGLCASTTLTRIITIAQQPRLRVAHFEVTQALQRADNSVRLVAGRATGVRAYVLSGLSGFSYTGDADQVTGVRATLTVMRNTVPVATVAATSGPPVLGPAFEDADRADVTKSFNFVVPVQHLTGPVELRVNAVVDARPFGVSDDPIPRTSSSRTVDFHPRKPLVLIRWRMRDDTVSPSIAAPTVAEWHADMVGAMDRFPVGDWVVGITPGIEELSTGDDELWTEDGWQDRIDDLDDIADRYADNGQIYVCVVPQQDYGLNGIAHASETRSWPRSDQHRVMLVRRGLPASYAHELAHTLGLHHAPDSDDPVNNWPERIDARLPKATEPGTVAWRASDGKLFAAPWAELMSYKTPSGGTYQDRWPSVASWDILFETLA